MKFTGILPIFLAIAVISADQDAQDGALPGGLRVPGAERSISKRSILELIGVGTWVRNRWFNGQESGTAAPAANPASEQTKPSLTSNIASMLGLRPAQSAHSVSKRSIELEPVIMRLNAMLRTMPSGHMFAHQQNQVLNLAPMGHTQQSVFFLRHKGPLGFGRPALAAASATAAGKPGVAPAVGGNLVKLSAVSGTSNPATIKAVAIGATGSLAAGAAVSSVASPPASTPDLTASSTPASSSTPAPASTPASSSTSASSSTPTSVTTVGAASSTAEAPASSTAPLAESTGVPASSEAPSSTTAAAVSTEPTTAASTAASAIPENSAAAASTTIASTEPATTAASAPGSPAAISTAAPTPAAGDQTTAAETLEGTSSTAAPTSAAPAASAPEVARNDFGFSSDNEMSIS